MNETMKTEHTKEPWFYQEAASIFGDFNGKDSSWDIEYRDNEGGGMIATCYLVPESEANAIHIVACVNACAKIPKPEAIPKLVAALQEIKSSWVSAIPSDDSKITRRLITTASVALKEAGIE